MTAKTTRTLAVLLTVAVAMCVCARAQHPETYALNDYPVSALFPLYISWTMDSNTNTAWFKAVLQSANPSSSFTIGLYAPDVPQTIHFSSGTAFVDSWAFGVSSNPGDDCYPGCGRDGFMPRKKVDIRETQNLDNVDVQYVGGEIVARWSRVFSTGDSDDWVIVPAENVILAHACNPDSGLENSSEDVMPKHIETPSRCAGEKQVQLGWTDADVQTNTNSSGGFSSPSGDFRASYEPNAAGDGILFSIEADTTGWLSIGWAPSSAAAHSGTDMVVASVSPGGALTILDTRSTSTDQPGTDAVDNIIPGTGTEASGVTAVTFERLYATGDTAGDVDIIDGVMKVHWAYASSDSPSAKHVAAGIVDVNLRSSGTLTPAPPAPPLGPGAGGTGGGGFTSFDGAFRVVYAVSADRTAVTFTATGATTGWLAFGFSFGARDHLNTEMWVFSVGNDGSVTAVDMYSTARALPTSDDALGGAQDLTDVSGSRTGSVTEVTFTRLVETGTPGDLTIVDGSVNLQYALGPGAAGASFSKHSNAGMGSVNFFSSAFVVGKPPPDFELDAGTGLIFTLLVVAFVWAVFRWARIIFKRYKLRKLRQAALLNGTPAPGPDPTDEWAVSSAPPLASNLPSDRRSVYYVGSEPVPAAQPDAVSDVEAVGSGAVLSLGGRARAVYDFSPGHEDEVRLSVGDMVTVNELYDDGWCNISHASEGKDGLVPQSYLSGVSRPAPPVPVPGPGPEAAAAAAGVGAGASSAVSGGAAGTAPTKPNLAKGQRNVVANIAFRLRHTRVPMTDYAVGDVLLAAAFLFVNIGWVWVWPYDDWYVRDSLGNVLAANSFLVALPATRNSVLVWVFGFPFDRTIMFHRWLGRWVLILATLHMAWYLGYWDSEPALDSNKEFNRPTNLYGFFAWMMGILIGASSIAWIRRKRFQVFYWSHFLFAAYYALACYHTAKFRPWAIAACVVYGLDRVIRWFWGLYPRRTTELTVKDGGVVCVRFAKHPLAKHRVGQYVFLNFPQISLLEWHPFTLSSGPHEATAEVHIKGLGNHTRALIARAENASSLWVRCDGPYGKLSLNHKRFPALVLCGGGVGVTPLMALLKTLYHVGVTPAAAAKHPISTVTQAVYFVWVVPTETVVSWFAPAIAEAKSKAGTGGYPQLQLFIHVTRQDTVRDPSLFTGRPDVAQIFAGIHTDLVGSAIPRVAVYTCGPGHLVSAAWDAASRHTGQDVRWSYHHETFDF